MKQIVLDDIHDFELEHIFECGQCFRWKREEDGSYTGVTSFGVMNVNKIKNRIFIEGEFVKNGVPCRRRSIYSRVCKRVF